MLKTISQAQAHALETVLGKLGWKLRRGPFSYSGKNESTLQRCEILPGENHAFLIDLADNRELEHKEATQQHKAGTNKRQTEVKQKQELA